MNEKLLSVNHLSKFFSIKGGLFQRVVDYVHAIDDVSFNIRNGETLGLVGESGCGKSTLGRCLIRLIEPTSGDIVYKGENIAEMDRKELWKNVQMVFQNPMSSLNPRLTIGYCVGEPLIVSGSMETEVKSSVMKLLGEIGLNPKHYGRFPHEFSGGQRQRIMIARALITDPEFIILDEPTSSLDVSVQAKILNLLNDIKKSRDITYLFISHDLSVIKHMSDRIIVMYVGKFMEMASKTSIFTRTLHPYTKLLLDSIPSPSRHSDKEGLSTLQSIELPGNIDLPKGCRFYQRCPRSMEICREEPPELVEIESEHFVACHLYS